MDIQTFASDTLGSIRVTMLEGEPQFYAVDLARALGYSDTQAMTRRIDPEDATTCTDNSSGQLRSYTILSESGLYAAILGSSKPEAKAFKRWVTSEILPSIRKTGGYTVDTAFKVPQTLSEALRLAADLSDRVEAQAAQIESQKPAVAFVEKFVEAKETQNLRVVAKVLQIKEKDFVSLLLSKGILFRSRGKLTPKAEHMEAGRFEVKEIVTRDGFATVQMRFTTSGVEWIARKVSEWAQKASAVALEAPTAGSPVPTPHLDAGRP